MVGRPTKRGRSFRNDSEKATSSRETVTASKRASINLSYHAFRENLEDEGAIQTHDLGRMNFKCCHCNALHFKSELVNGHYKNCCYNGLINLPDPTINDDLKALIYDHSKFIKHIRQYNSAMAFASFSASRIDIPGVGPYVFKIQGQAHRFISDLLSSDNQSPSYGQLYFIDSSSASNFRSSRDENSDLHESVFNALQDILSTNPYALSYKKAAEVMENESELLDLSLRFVDNVSLDKRIYNKPTSDEIAGIFNSKEGEPPGHRHVVMHHRQGGPKLLSVLSPHVDPMIYPLLFPNGEPGWDCSLTHNGPRKQAHRQRLTMLQFACHRLAIRKEFSHIHQSRALFQQYIVDMYTRVEGERLKYVRDHQSILRVEHYKGLQDFVINRSELDNVRVGKPVVLPSSFEGSPRNMSQRYQDAMAITRQEGKPDIFLTFTCNPRWTEIISELKSGETPSDRPDIVSRVFRCKLNELKNDILKKNVLGVVVAHIYVIEFQKRGLPHCHMLLILDEKSKFKEPSHIDSCVCAEIPDVAKFPRLHDVVLSCMIHGPCGERNPNAPCMKDGKCSKGYPKDFSDNTCENLNGYPVYRRRDNGMHAFKGCHRVDNRDVVPYNPYLSLKYNAHINVEVCSSIRSIKYLYKYLYKGYDSASLQVVNNDGEEVTVRDEISAFLNMRYISPPESIWRLHANEMHEQSHTVVRLAVHEDGFQNIYFNDGMEEAALEVAGSKHTTLTAWFELNKNDVKARQYLYTEIPKHYRFANNAWIKRKNNSSKIIGRMYGVVPTDYNRFYLRLLLLHIKGATSFKDMLTHDNRVYSSFKEVAVALGILEDDSEWNLCLNEMQTFHMPKQLREMFAYICCFCQPQSPIRLWDTFKDALVEDFKSLNKSDNENEALSHIDLILRTNALSCEKIGLPIPREKINIITPSYDANTEAMKGEQMFHQLNYEQKQVVMRILNAVDGATEEHLFFLEAPGGYGKTFVYSCILHILRGRGHVALASAWTGIASLLLEGGTTLHRLFGLPVPVSNSSVSKIKVNTEKAKLLRDASVIVIDEASMIPDPAVNCIDLLLRDIMKCVDKSLGDKPMGGKIIVFGGNFMQVLPVVPMGGKVQIIESCFQNNKIWKSLVKLSLTTNMRTKKNEKEFSEWLLKLGRGTLQSDFGKDIIEIPSTCLCGDISIVTHVFGTSLNQNNINNFINHAIVSPLNESCDKLNDQVLSIVDGEMKEYVSVDAIISDEPQEHINIPIEYLNSITPSGLPHHRLKLKIGATVILLRNMNLSSGLVNGVRLQILNMNERSLHLRIITGPEKGKKIFMPRIKLISNDPNIPFSMSRVQFPFKLGFSTSINKSQGQTLDKIGIYLPKPVFSHGQLYVGFSRVKSIQDVKVCIEEAEDQGIRNGRTYTKNVVWKEVLM